MKRLLAAMVLVVTLTGCEFPKGSPKGIFWIVDHNDGCGVECVTKLYQEHRGG